MSTYKLFERRKQRVRYKIKQTASAVRLSVFRSNKHIYAQIIDDNQHLTLAHASTQEKELNSLKSKSNKEAAQKVGELIAQRAKQAKVEKVVFDRGGYLFHGRVKALADAAREAGLKF